MMNFIVQIAVLLLFSSINFINGSPLPENQDQDYNNFTGVSKNSSLETSTSLLCVQAIWRHGARNQLYTFPTDEHNPSLTKAHGQEGLEQLTLDGVKGSFRLGKFIRSRYDNFISKNFSLSEISVVSSGTHRTVMTALSVAQGLFPNIINSGDTEEPNQFWYPVPVMTIPLSTDNSIYQLRPCKRHSEIFSKYKNSSEINTQEVLELYKYLTLHSGLPVHNYEDLYQLQDTIFNVQHTLFKFAIPEWAISVQKQMFDLARLEYYGFADSFEMMRFVAGPLLHKIIYNFNCTLGIRSLEKDDNCKYVKMYGFSGHDTTISPLLYLFQEYDINYPPPYNALLLFELHQQGNENLVRIFYHPKNDKGDNSITRELLLKSCGGVPCEFNKFQEIYKEFTIDDVTWEKECCDTTSPVSEKRIWSS